MGHRVALAVLATAAVLGVLGCGGAGKHTQATLTSTFSSQCDNCGVSDHAVYRAVAVRAAFKRDGLRLKNFGYLTLNSVPHVQLLGYSVPEHVTASGTPIGGLYFEVYIFRNAPAAKRALAGPYVADLRLAQRPWRRLSNLALVAKEAVIPANRNRTVWRKAVTVLESLAH
jgi:hypothetical protein